MKLLKFEAGWCHQCHQMDKEMPQIKCPTQVIDIDKNEDLTDKYNIKVLPTMILIKGNYEVHRWEGFTKAEDINKVIEL